MERYWIWLADRKRLTQGEKLALRQKFPSVQALYEATDYGPDIGGVALNSLLDKDLAPAEKILADCKRRGAGVLTPDDARYPQRLRQIPDPPVVLYYLGTLPDFDNEIPIAMVGTRRPTAYGLMSAGKLGGEIAQAGGLVVSGVAYGVDAEAMWGAVRAGKPVVGVLGCGIDVVYPQQNRELYRAAEAQGCLISEYAPGIRPNQWTFPKRNRIISGLSLAVVVVEAPEKSGTMITAADARRQGRDLFAVPGHIQDENCAGSNRLLATGAIPVTCGKDVVERYTIEKKPGPKPLKPAAPQKPAAPKKPAAPEKPVQEPPTVPRHVPETGRNGAARMDELSPREQLIVRQLMEKPATVNMLISATGLTASQIRVCLTMLEMKKLVRYIPGGRVELI